MLVFALIAILSYPDGHEVVLRLGDNWTAAECATEARRADVQLNQTFSIAKVEHILCVPSRGA